MKSIPYLYRTLYALSLFLLVTACWEKVPDPDPVTGRSDEFETVPQRFPLEAQVVDEASGLVDSRTLDGYLWTHEDAGNWTALYLISKDGKQIRQYLPEGIVNRDWEDIAVGTGPREGVSYLYVGDIGNNDANPATDINFIYRMPELTSLDGTFRRGDIEQLIYRYPDSPRDAETLLFDPISKDLFIISKEFDRANIYRLPYPLSPGGVVTAELVGNIPSVYFATGGDISPDGTEILIRTYTNIYYWKRKPNESVGQTLTRPSVKSLPYELEPQGEAVCFDKEANGYYTLSERRAAPSVTLNYFKRK
ncbi:PE-PGRS family protein [Telluribacter sp.]|jgi:hypothetical protein|uniref:PE-PGRS family protein n=1 Tax=Telluribacter sp. TaxID=1978767 RepID=UPI002E0E921C|nr:PE-PGRS family protein [Telluribacter sp.]